MKVEFNRQEINDAITPLMCAVSGKSTLSAVDGILIDANEDGSCVLTTFDMVKGMRRTVQANVEEAGSYIINAQKFMQTLRVMDGDKILLEIDEKFHACITCGKSIHKMNALSGSDYPIIPRLVTEDGFVIVQSMLKEMLSKVMYAMAANDQRPVLNGCYFRVTEEELMAVACDSFKLARCVTKTEIENKNEDKSKLRFSFIVPTKSINELFKLLSDNEEDTVRVYMTRKNIVFHFGDLIFFSHLIEGEYIDFDRIIIKAHKMNVVVDRPELISALERAALVTEEKVVGSVRSHVKLEFVGGILKISAVSDLGATYDELEVEQNGDDLLIAFNNRFLIDSLRASSSDRVRISLSTSLTSINIEPAEPDDGIEELFMLLPVRMKE